MTQSENTRIYQRSECAVFRKTKEEFGGLSNMAPGFPVRVNDVRVPTVEALYQACRFPHREDIQRLIIDQHSPMTAKMVSKPHRANSRADWNNVRVKIMRWCLRIKLTMNWTTFSRLLLSTGDKPIVEDSRKDDFWGAIPTDSQTLVGMNVLGRLLMELREEIKAGAELRRVEIPSIPNFLLFSEQIQIVDFRADKNAPIEVTKDNLSESNSQFSLPLFVNSDDEKTVYISHINKDRGLREKKKGMTEGLKPHAKYKNSGLLWVPEIPTHWELIPNRAVLKKRKVLVGGNHKNYQLLSLTKGGVIVRDVSTGKGKFSSDMGSSQEVRKGDFVFCLFDVPETPRTVGLSEHYGMITSAYTVFETRKLSHNSVRYFERFYISMDDRKVLSPLYSGLRNTIPPPRFLGTKTPQPPPDEQAAIVGFLDNANRKIDGFIRTKRKLIGLLNEQKQAIIHRAVTRGFNPNVSLKASGISWLGDIPSHWQVLRAKYLFREVDDRSKEGKETHLAMSQRLGLAPSNMVKSAMRSESYAGAKLCQEGDLVLNRLKAHLGVFALAKQGGVISPDYSIFRKRAAISMEYFESTLRSTACRSELRIRAKGLVEGFWRLYTDDFYDIRLPVPPLDEQREIISAMTVETADLDTAITRTEREITLMQEYRTRLTADIVTGKLDVREAAAKLPEHSAEADSGSVIEEIEDVDLGDEVDIEEG